VPTSRMPTFAVLVNAFVTRISRPAGVGHSLREPAHARQRISPHHGACFSPADRVTCPRVGPMAGRARSAVAAAVVSQPHPTPRRAPIETDLTSDLPV
jgi:hypothetical protein